MQRGVILAPRGTDRTLQYLSNCQNILYFDHAELARANLHLAAERKRAHSRSTHAKRDHSVRTERVAEVIVTHRNRKVEQGQEPCISDPTVHVHKTARLGS